MYNETDREQLLNRIIAFMRGSSAFEGLLQIGSGAVGFADIYSDIDLMAGCFGTDHVKAADQQLWQFFTELGACHMEKRAWTSTALGLSVYFENGLSADISFMPTAELPIRSPQFKVVFAKTKDFTDMVSAASQRFEEHSGRYGLDDSIHYRFVSELRYVEIALLREQFVFADIALGNARQLLLAVEAVTEGKKLHQFKACNSLSQPFLDRLEETYPRSRTYVDMHTAKDKLLALDRYETMMHDCAKDEFLIDFMGEVYRNIGIDYREMDKLFAECMDFYGDEERSKSAYSDLLDKDAKYLLELCGLPADLPVWEIQIEDEIQLLLLGDKNEPLGQFCKNGLTINVYWVAAKACEGLTAAVFYAKRNNISLANALLKVQDDSFPVWWA